MKKSLLALILAVTMVAPVFAAEGDISINGKLGLGISNNLNVVPEELPDDISFGVNMEMPISIGAEIFYGLMNGLSVGAGINYGFSSDSKSDAMGDGKVKAQTTNFYLAVRPEFKVESDIFSWIYLIGQIGGSSISFEAEGEKVLVVEDVITTGLSTREVIESLKETGAEIVAVCSLVDRSAGKVDFGVPRFSLLSLEVKSYKPEECPLCKDGSKPIKPGSRK